MDKLGNDFEHFCSLQSHHVTTCFQINGSTYLHFSPLLVGDTVRDTPKEWAIGSYGQATESTEWYGSTWEWRVFDGWTFSGGGAKGWYQFHSRIWRRFIYTKEEDDDDHWPPRQFKAFYFKQIVNILTCYIGATMIGLEFSYRCFLPIWHRVATFHFSFLWNQSNLAFQIRKKTR